MNEFFYDFQFDNENRGYSYLSIDAIKLYSFTRFVLDSNKVFTNTFMLKLNDNEILACKHGDLDWVYLNEKPPHHFPGCAYPLLLPRAEIKPYTYVQISEDDGSVIGKTQLRRELNDIIESQNGAICRKFTMEGEIPVRIDWGGAVSHLCSTSDESVRDSGLSFAVE